MDYEAFAFIGSAGYSITSVKKIHPDGSVDVTASRPVDKFVYHLTTTLDHICITVI